MRISGGRACGIPLRVPRGHDFRPATDRLRQGVFSSLGDRVVGATFADLFAGTGSYGLEALSRGAAGGYFVEREPRAVAALRRNIDDVCRSSGAAAASVRVFPVDALRWSPPDHEPVDLVFADPPFAGIGLIAETLFRQVAGFMQTNPPGIFVFEMPGEVEVGVPGWTMLRRIGRGRGQPTCCLYSLAADSAPAAG
jgi:16S rRNA (guanine966-N2)-methyltransferase